jgi:alkylation response protein AidB-like acyl-CoA dehydrogenase
MLWLHILPDQYGEYRCKDGREPQSAASQAYSGLDKWRDIWRDFAAIKTQATETHGGWLLNGSKAWITNAEIADLFVTYVQTDPAKGWKGIACFVVDARKKGFRRGEIYNIMGGRAIGAGEFHLQNYFVSEEDLLAPPIEAFKKAMELQPCAAESCNPASTMRSPMAPGANPSVGP